MKKNSEKVTQTLKRLKEIAKHIVASEDMMSEFEAQVGNTVDLCVLHNNLVHEFIEKQRLIASEGYVRLFVIEYGNGSWEASLRPKGGDAKVVEAFTVYPEFFHIWEEDDYTYGDGTVTLNSLILEASKRWTPEDKPIWNKVVEFMHN